MVKQSIIDKSELTNFLASGAILQVGLDQFKLIWGPFTPVSLDEAQISDEKTIIYQPDFWDFTEAGSKKNTAFVGVKQANISKEQLLELLNQQKPVEPVAIHWGQVTEAAFTEQFRWSQKQFQSGELIKTVPIISQRGEVVFSLDLLTQSLVHVISGDHYGTTYGFWNNGVGYLGHTPELILQFDNNEHVVKTMALAGTMDSRKESVEAILHDKKILEEHQIVVDDIIEALKKMNADKKIHVDAIRVLQLKHLCHLQTEIRILDVKSNEVLNYLQAIHPTAALGLYPRKLDQYDQFKKFELQNSRRNFAAPFAFISKNEIKAVAAIRLFYFDRQHIQIVSGCGVTAKSILGDELKELETKRNSVKRMMGFSL